jgi:hypothetical protein
MKRPKLTDFEKAIRQVCRQSSRELAKLAKTLPPLQEGTPPQRRQAPRMVLIIEDKPRKRTFEEETFFCLNSGCYPDERF